MDGSYVPIFQVPPQYPRRAAERGIEGCVVLKYVVTEVGSFDDFAAIKLVVESSGAVKNMTMLEAIDFTKATTKASEVASGQYKAPGQ